MPGNLLVAHRNGFVKRCQTASAFCLKHAVQRAALCSRMIGKTAGKASAHKKAPGQPKWAVDRDITSGTSRYTFSPDAACTRAQVVTFLWRAAGSPAPMLNKNPFTDVRAGGYYYDAVLWAVQNGITAGMDYGAFDPDTACSDCNVPLSSC